ncbi:hypothetical protein [Marilutibacter maris]|uniref:Uncharacterized protein n=2 Tax=Marilutibacter maris TaxID=1605891 RepID=A0A508AS94_9GAMM|nr:hypothetical protein [Lysobacter maris]KAB8190460.1 hypothetical protein FKV24_008585 [Lysobacter maris]
MKAPRDKNGSPVAVGMRVRLLGLSAQWLDDLSDDEKAGLLSMVGEVFEIEEIDEYGQPWVRKFWFDEDGEACAFHSIGLEAQEMEVVDAAVVDEDR